MSAIPEKEPPVPITLRSARELFEVLRNPDAHVTMALHRSLCREPQRAMLLGTFEGRDVVDEVLAQAEAEGESTRGLLLARTLTVFPTARVARFFRNMFLASERAEFLRVSAAWLAAQPDDEERDSLIQGLLQDACTLRAREAARWLRTDADLHPAARLRVSLLDTRDDPLPAPPPRPPYLAAWLAELDGPFEEEARDALASFGPVAVQALSRFERRLNADTRDWLTRLALQTHAPGAGDMVWRTLYAVPDLPPAD